MHYILRNLKNYIELSFKKMMMECWKLYCYCFNQLAHPNFFATESFLLLVDFLQLTFFHLILFEKISQLMHLKEKLKYLLYIFRLRKVSRHMYIYIYYLILVHVNKKKTITWYENLLTQQIVSWILISLIKETR